jgi:hypothetical protein
MSYADVLVVGLSGALFVAAAFGVRHGLRAGRPEPMRTTKPAPGHEEDLVWPVTGAAGEPAWATQDELPWQDIIGPPLPRNTPGKRTA